MRSVLSNHYLPCLTFPCLAVATKTLTLYFIPSFDSNLRYNLAVTVAMGKSMDAIIVDDERTGIDCIR
jgi:hypothetical protein